MSSAYFALPLSDRLTLSSFQSADLMSESIRLAFDKIHTTPAVDQFLGEEMVFDKKWQGENIRYFKPKKPLSLFELALLANTVHEMFPDYSLLREQCYFFAAVVYLAAEHLAGVESGSPEYSQGLLHIDNSLLSNRYGRWNGALVNKIDPEEFIDVLAKYRENLVAAIVKVKKKFLQISINIYILHR